MALKKVPPIDLLTHNRFDLPAKHIFGWFIEHGIKSSWGRRLYSEHLQVWNNFRERNPPKKGLEAFVESFKSMLTAVHGGKFRFKELPAPINNHGSLLNGSHRWAAAMLHNKQMWVKRGPKNLGQTCNYIYFREKKDFVKTGLSEKFMDAMALEFCRLKKTAYMLVVFPVAKGRGEFKHIIRKYGSIFYAKGVELHGQGPMNLIRQLYPSEAWAADDRGLVSKVNPCFMGKSRVRVFVVDVPSMEAMMACKEEIRQVFHVGKHSCHATDSHADTLRVAGALLNANSIAFMEKARRTNRDRFFLNLSKYRGVLKGRTSDNFCVTGSGVLAMYGLRDARDIDCLCRGSLKGPSVSDHWSEAKYYDRHFDDIVFNPEHHFYSFGLKFATPAVVSAMKQKRGEPKDKKDVGLLKNVL